MNQTWTEKLAANDRRHADKNSLKKQKRVGIPMAPNRRMSLSPLSASDDGVRFGNRPSFGGGGGVYLSSTARAETAMFFHCLFLGENGVPCVHVEERNDRRCPFCFHDAVSIVLVLSIFTLTLLQVVLPATFHPCPGFGFWHGITLICQPRG